MALKQVISLDGVWKLQYFDFGVSVGQFREDYVVVADDNYFDLMPNEERSLSIKVRDVKAQPRRWLLQHLMLKGLR